MFNATAKFSKFFSLAVLIMGLAVTAASAQTPAPIDAGVAFAELQPSHFPILNTEILVKLFPDYRVQAQFGVNQHLGELFGQSVPQTFVLIHKQNPALRIRVSAPLLHFGVPSEVLPEVINRQSWRVVTVLGGVPLPNSQFPASHLQGCASATEQNCLNEQKVRTVGLELSGFARLGFTVEIRKD